LFSTDFQIDILNIKVLQGFDDVVKPAHISHPHTNRHYTILLKSRFISRDSTIHLFSLCVHRDVPTTPLGSMSVHRPCQAYTHYLTVLLVRSQGICQGCTYKPTGLPVPNIEYRIWNIQEQTRTQVCLHSPHTHTHTPNQPCWTPGPSPETVQSHWAPCAFTGSIRDTPTIPLVQ